MADSKLAKKHELYRRGILHWRLRPDQKQMYDAIRTANPDVPFTALCNRRKGKTYVLCTIAWEDCIRKPGTLISYVSTTIKELKRAIYPAMLSLLDDCPQELKPSYNQQESYYQFPNGSRITIAAANNGHADDLRGSTAHKAFIDEAGQIDNLKYLLQSIIAPSLSSTRGQMIIASTPADTAAHEFFDVSETSRLNEAFFLSTIYDCTHLDVTREAAQYTKGVDDDGFKREYLCQWITSSDRIIVAEFIPDKHIKELERNQYYPLYVKYTIMDMGFKNDFTFIVFGTYHFHEARFYVQREYFNKGIETLASNIAEKVKATEKELWGESPNVIRIADNNEPRFIADLGINHDVWFRETTKESLKSMVNNLKEWTKEDRIMIDPACTNLIGCFKYGVWDKQMKEFDRVPIYGHFDGLAAMVYGTRNIIQNNNPIPRTHGYSEEHHLVPVHQPTTDEQIIEQMFPLLKRNK